jgi:hypothetical protein
VLAPYLAFGELQRISRLPGKRVRYAYSVPLYSAVGGPRSLDGQPGSLHGTIELRDGYLSSATMIVHFPIVTVGGTAQDEELGERAGYVYRDLDRAPRVIAPARKYVVSRSKGFFAFTP